MIKKLFEKYRSMSSVVKAGMWFTVCNFLQKGINFITMPFFTRIMTTEEYGLYSIYSSWYSILVTFATLHLSYYVFNKGLVKYEEDKENFIVSIQSLSVTVTAFFIAIYFLFKNQINNYIGLPTTMILLLLIQILFEPPILYWTARKRFEYKYKAVILVTISIAILNPLIGIFLIKLYPFENAALARVFSISLVTTAFGALFGFIIARKGDKPFSSKYWKYALAFNLPLIPHYLSTSILSSADRIMIGNIVGESEAGIYSVAYSIGMVSMLFSQAIQQAYLPWLYKRMKERDYKGIPAISNIFLIGIMILLTLAMCFAPEVVWIVGSNKYLDAIWVVPPVCASVFFIFLQNMFANIEYYFEKTKLISVASVAVALLNIVLNYIFINTAGYLAAGYTTLFCYIGYSIVHYVVMAHICKQNNIEFRNFFDIKSTVAISLSMILIVGIMLLIYINNYIRYFILVGIVIAILIERKRLIGLAKMIMESKTEHK